MKLESLFREAIKAREGKEVDSKMVQRLLDATLEGHLCIPGGEANGPITSYEGNLLFEKYAFLEGGIAHHIARLLKRKSKAWEGSIENTQLNEKQREAVLASMRYDMVVVTGGPGTGKTFTIAQCIREFTQARKIVVAAPTGKAAAHLQAGIEKALPGNTVITSGTLHSILGIRDSYDALNKDLYLGADLIVIDECSMIDVSMWYALLRAVSEKSKLLLVGDTDQLPPVETGSIFSHLCMYMREHYSDRCVHLTKCLRSDSEEIVALSQAINRGDSEGALRVLHEGKRVGFTKELTFPPFPNDASPRELLHHAATYRILAALKEGEYGVHALNGRFSYQYRRGEVWAEPIIITQSNRELGLFNGENGVAIRYKETPEKDVAYFPSKEGEILSIPLPLLPRYELAYALSIHKSQGSEYDHVVIVLQRGAELFGRELIYTGITRAKKTVHIYGNEEILKESMGKHTIRTSTLQRRLEEEI